MLITTRTRLLLVGLALTPALALSQGRGAAAGRAQAPPPFQFELLGPSFGGRIASIAGVAGDERTWYLGAASGGVWKSTDDGNTFTPIFDKESAMAIGALAVAPSDPNIVWAGTGEAWAIRDVDVMGDGIYKSTDAGATWTDVGLGDVGRIGRILVHPTNPNVVYVCALGRGTGPQQERGVYRTTDGGRNWQRVLFVDENTGCSGLTLDIKDPNTLFAGMWQMVMHTYAHVQRRAVERHLRLPRCRHDVDARRGSRASEITTRQDRRRNRADRFEARLCARPDGRPGDPCGARTTAAATWKAVNWMRALIGHGAGYYINIKVGSGDANEVFIANSSFFHSTDGGVTFTNVPWGGDNHDIWIDPKNPDHIGLTDDAGAHLTTDHMRSQLNVTLPIGQMYHVALDARIPYWVYTNRQDNGTMRGPSDVAEALPTTGGHAAPPVGAGRGGRGGRGAAAGEARRRSATGRAETAPSIRRPPAPVFSADAVDAAGTGPCGARPSSIPPAR